ncbi:hypothetical protein KY311_01410 [Candidatus Woesearchaeota archaeon]|nr:hypothetical protein [Candidatus Woesearchaeota archaeon]MBW3017282.1 hypothetical protein [Candidatus Woesearchaeota archaeon]
MGEDYSNMRLEEFLSRFSNISPIRVKGSRDVMPYLEDPLDYQKKIVTRAVSDIPYFLSTGKGSGTVNSIMLNLIYQSRVKSGSLHIAQCYLALVPVVLGPGAVHVQLGDFKFMPHLDAFYRALRKAGQEEPPLFSDPERTFSDLYSICVTWEKEKSYKFKASDDNRRQLAAIVENAKHRNEFLSIFYKYIVASALKIE